MKIAFCTTCKGRIQHVQRVLAKNIWDNPGPDSIFVLLDYNSDDGLGDFIKEEFSAAMACGKLVYYRNNEAMRFKMAHAKNMAHRAAIREGADILVNLDADNFTGEGFADYVQQAFERTQLDPQEIFLWSRMIKGVLPRGITGRIVVTRNAFLIVGGYDEKYETHSPDDKDFNMRLRRLGYCAQEIDPYYLQAVNHTDKMRFREYPSARETTNGNVSPVARVVNYGNIGCGTVFRNFDPTPIVLEPVPTRLFGIGMHKTATQSLHSALQILGIKSGHWENAHWAKAIWTEMKHTGKSPTLERCYAVSDTPIPQLYKELDKAYPNSKFIFTVRDEKEWIESVRRHFDATFNPFAKSWNTDPFSHQIHNHVYGRKKFDEVIFLTAYQKYNAEVLEYFKDRPDDLLVMDMSQKAGWKELCTFLEMPVPAVDYPRSGVTGAIEIKEEIKPSVDDSSQQPDPDPDPPANNISYRMVGIMIVGALALGFFLWWCK